MTHDEIKKLGERELYERVFLFVLGDSQANIQNIEIDPLRWSIKDALWLCYQAEEKLDSMGSKRERGKILWKLLYGEGCGVRVDDQGFPIAMWSHIASLTRVHPRQRAQAILMTIEDTKGGDHGV